MKKITKHLVLSAFFLLGLAPVSAYADTITADAIGKAADIVGTVTVQRGDKMEITALEAGDPIFLKDTVLTDEGDFAELEFIDETVIEVSGGGGRLKIDEYVFNPDAPEENKARFNVLRSSFKYVSGLVAKNDNVEIGLDFGSIGIRGTTLYRAMRDGECWIFLEDGEIKVNNNAGFVTLNPGDGTRMRDVSIAPTPAKPWGQKNIDWIKGEVARPQ